MPTGNMRLCDASDRDGIATIINRAAERYRGVIPADRWREPYMPAVELDHEIASGVVFHGFEEEARLLGVMGIQAVDDVHLIRHAYVLPETQGRGIGGRLLQRLVAQCSTPILVGTWAAASWAIGFYQRNGFSMIAADEVPALLRRYWNIPERQIETSVVLARQP